MLPNWESLGARHVEFILGLMEGVVLFVVVELEGRFAVVIVDGNVLGEMEDDDRYCDCCVDMLNETLGFLELVDRSGASVAALRFRSTTLRFSSIACGMVMVRFLPFTLP